MIVLALEFDESPMRYFTEDTLKQMGYTKRHYTSQLGHAFFENLDRLDYLVNFEKQRKSMNKKAKET